MPQATAGKTITAKVEDASKSEHISAKVLTSNHPDYTADTLHDFPRSLLS